MILFLIGAWRLKMEVQENQQQIDEQQFKIFDLYNVNNIEIKDPALKPYINLNAKLLLKSHGRIKEKLAKVKVNIVERLASRLQVPGHLGKKHKIITSLSSGKYNRNMQTMLDVL